MENDTLTKDQVEDKYNEQIDPLFHAQEDGATNYGGDHPAIGKVVVRCPDSKQLNILELRLTNHELTREIYPAQQKRNWFGFGKIDTGSSEFEIYELLLQRNEDWSKTLHDDTVSVMAKTGFAETKQLN
ncbi:hypothetical protein CL622_04345 [archaeon]|nr:hypothetical protein [archaeon]